MFKPTNMKIKLSAGMVLGAFLLPGTSPTRAATITGKVRCQGMPDNAGAVVYIARCLDRSDLRFAPSKENAVIDQYNLNFVPRILPILRGTRVAFPNSDKVSHNVFSPSRAKRFNLGSYPGGEVRYMVFDQPGLVVLLCNIHPEMQAFVMVTETPFFAVTTAEGEFEIGNVPSGRHLLKTWHESLSPVSQEIEVKGPSLVLEIELVLD